MGDKVVKFGEDDAGRYVAIDVAGDVRLSPYEDWPVTLAFAPSGGGDPDPPEWRGTLGELFEGNVETMDEEDRQEMVRALVEKGVFMGGGGAQPISVVRFDERAASRALARRKTYEKGLRQRLRENPDDDEDDEDDEGCPLCGGPPVPLGALGHLHYARCRSCGHTYVSRGRENPGPRGGVTEVVSVLFPKREYTVRQAKDWLRRHEMKAPAADKGGPGAEFLRFRQLAPATVKKRFRALRTIPFGKGIKALVGVRKGAPLLNPEGDVDLFLTWRAVPGKPWVWVDGREIPQSPRFASAEDALEWAEKQGAELHWKKNPRCWACGEKAAFAVETPDVVVYQCARHEGPMKHPVTGEEFRPGPLEERHRRTPSAPGRPNPSVAEYREDPILRRVVGRRHVGEPLESVIEYALSRMKPAALKAMSDAERRRLELAIKEIHQENRALYNWVMGGLHGYTDRRKNPRRPRGVHFHPPRPEQLPAGPTSLGRGMTLPMAIADILERHGEPFTVWEVIEWMSDGRGTEEVRRFTENVIIPELEAHRLWRSGGGKPRSPGSGAAGNPRKPSLKRLREAFGEEKGERVWKLLAGELPPEEFASVRKWLGSVYADPTEEEMVMEAINEILEGYGVEAIRGRHVDSYHYDVQATYVNMGDSYVPTIVFDNETAEYSLTSFGDWVEAHEKSRELW